VCHEQVIVTAFDGSAARAVGASDDDGLYLMKIEP